MIVLVDQTFDFGSASVLIDLNAIDQRRQKINQLPCMAFVWPCVSALGGVSVGAETL